VLTAEKEKETRVSGPNVDEIAGVDPGRWNLVTLWNSSVRALRRSKYQKVTRQKKNLIRQQRLDGKVANEIQPLSQRTSEVATLEAFTKQMQAQLSVW
jgi:hypothetical protein